MNRKRALLASMLVAMLIFTASPMRAQVLGSCGTSSENDPAAVETGEKLVNTGIPLPGERAVNFELPAVIKNEIKLVKLSDYNGKWRVVCFYPADFTFV